MSDDQINGLWELFGAYFIFTSVLKVRQDKVVKGLDWRQVAFFFGWGLWNLRFYPNNGLWYSFAGGCLIVAMNLVWLAHVAWYALAVRQPSRVELPANSPLA